LKVKAIDKYIYQRMRDYTYNFEIEDLIVQFIDAFNDVVIKRYNKDRAVEDHLHVNFVYAPKKRVLYDVVNKNPNPRNLPIISVYIDSIDRDRDRVENKIEKSYFVNDSGTPKQRRQPVPVKVQMSMSVITKSTNDMLQILSNWVPYTDPYIYIDVIDPSTKQTLRTKVEWSGSIRPEQEIDDPKETFRTGFSTSFTIYGYLFKKIIEDGGNICKITTNMSSVTSLNKCFFDLKEFETSIGLTSAYKSTFVINGVPYLKCINPTYLVLGHEKYDFTITGKNLDFTSHLFVSGQPGMFPVSAYSYYNFFPNLSTVSAISPCAEVPATTTIVIQSSCQPFSAIPISAFTVTENGQSMQFTLPYNPEVFGVFDIIATSKCGCARLSLDSILDEINPYPPGTPEYENFIPYQPPPAVNGGVVVVPIDFQSIMSRISALESLTARSVNTSIVVESNSSYWNQSYSTLTAFSALWSTGGPGGGASVVISITAPTTAKNGDLWWDSSVGNGYIWYVDNDGGQWVPFATIQGTDNTLSIVSSNSANWNSTYTIVSAYSAVWMQGGSASVTISTIAPVTAKNGDLWWDSSVGNGYIWYVDNDGGQWVPFANMPGSYEAISIIQTNSAKWDSSFTALTSTSSNWNQSYTNLTANSSNWNSTYSTVQSNSASWGIGASNSAVNNVVTANSGNWNQSYVALTSTSATWNSTYSIVQANSSAWGTSTSNSAVNNTVTANSSNWNQSYTNLTANSANWNSAYSSVTANSSTWGVSTSNSAVNNTVTANSGNWNQAYTALTSTSGNWNNVYTTVQSNSSTWGTSTSNSAVNNAVTANSGNWNQAYTNLTANSANWNSTYSTVQSNSSTWGTSITTSAVNNVVTANSSNWNSTYSTVQSNSSTWGTSTGNSAVNSVVTANSGNWNQSYIALTSTSSNWNSTYSTVQSNSSTWGASTGNSAVNNAVTANSANWNSSYFVLTSTSANWDSTYSIVQSNSSTWGTSTGNSAVNSVVTANSGNWNNVYSAVTANSTTWNNASSIGSITPNDANLIIAISIFA